MTVEAQDFYERLGVSSTAGQVEIKKAYVQAVRAYPPERYPEEFRRIREAYETLSDVESRGEYDATSDPRTLEAITAGQEALTAEDPSTAVKHFKKALVLQPDAHFARNLLGLALGYAEDHEGSRAQFLRLTEDVPENPVYWHNRGHAEHVLERLTDAEWSFRTAIHLNPEESGPLLGLANVLFDQDRKDAAESVLEDAIQADGVVDFDDISYFFELIKFKVRDQDVDGIEEVTKRIERFLNDDGQRTRVAYRYAVLANELSEFLAFDLAAKLARQSRHLVPHDEQIVEFSERVLGNHELMQQWRQVQEDEDIRGGFKFFLAVALRSHFGAWESEAEKAEEISRGVDVLENVAGLIVSGREGKRSLAGELDLLEERYPRIAGIVNDGAKAAIRRTSATATSVAVECPHCGYIARSTDKTGRYTCPGCHENFDYNSLSGRTTGHSGLVEAQGWMTQGRVWIAWIVGLWLLSALLGG